MGYILHMPSSIDAAFADPDAPFNRGEEAYSPDPSQVEDAMCDCGHVFYTATLPQGIVASEYLFDWDEAWTPFYDASGLVYCSKECRDDAEDGLNAARGILTALIISCPFWIGVGLYFAGVKL